MYRLLMLHNFFAAPLLLLWPFSVRGWPLHKFIVCVQCVTVRALLQGGALLSERRETLFRLCFAALWCCGEREREMISRSALARALIYLHTCQ
jgi:hypothetical protein